MEFIHTNEAATVSEQDTPSLRKSIAAPGAGFSLVELLLVLSIIALVAALILPAANRARVKARTQQARLEMGQIQSALTAYESQYGRFPVSAEVGESAEPLQEDMTYGGVIEETHIWLAGPCFLTNNSELVAALLDLEYFGDGAPTLNYGHVQNPQRSKFLEARFRGGTNAAAGVGIDGVYRDPWGSPYMVTLDLNGDGRARDILYRYPAVSQDPANPEGGLGGFIKTANAQGDTVFEAAGRVLVWSAGPDRHVDCRERADQGVNRDNILTHGR